MASLGGIYQGLEATRMVIRDFEYWEILYLLKLNFKNDFNEYICSILLNEI